MYGGDVASASYAGGGACPTSVQTSQESPTVRGEPPVVVLREWKAALECPVLGRHPVLRLVPDEHGLLRHVLFEHGVGVAVLVDQPKPAALVGIGLSAVKVDLVALGARTNGEREVRVGGKGGLKMGQGRYEEAV